MVLNGELGLRATFLHLQNFLTLKLQTEILPNQSSFTSPSSQLEALQCSVKVFLLLYLSSFIGISPNTLFACLILSSAFQRTQSKTSGARYSVRKQAIRMAPSLPPGRHHPESYNEAQMTVPLLSLLVTWGDTPSAFDDLRIGNIWGGTMHTKTTALADYC